MEREGWKVLGMGENGDYNELMNIIYYIKIILSEEKE